MTTKATRDSLLDIGVEVMHGHGYGATGLKEILALAKVPKGSFYHHFGSKEEFAAAVLERYAAREMGRWKSILNNGKLSPLKSLRRYFEELMKVYGQKGPIPGCLMGNLSLEIANESAVIRELLSDSFAHWQHAIAPVIQLAVARKELPPSTKPDSLASF